MTAREIAEQLGMTYHAVRLHLIGLERDGTLRVVGERGSTRPASVYDIGAGVESALSNAYVPFASHLTSVLGERLPKRALGVIMGDVGRRLASSFPRPRGSLRERAAAASTLLNDLGAPNEVVQEDVLRIRSSGCLLAEAIHGQPYVCNAMAAFLGELLDADVRQCCNRTAARPRCCFEIRRAG